MPIPLIVFSAACFRMGVLVSGFCIGLHKEQTACSKQNTSCGKPCRECFDFFSWEVGQFWRRNSYDPSVIIEILPSALIRLDIKQFSHIIPILHLVDERWWTFEQIWQLVEFLFDGCLNRIVIY